jgi:hypothetical protein
MYRSFVYGSSGSRSSRRSSCGRVDRSLHLCCCIFICLFQSSNRVSASHIEWKKERERERDSTMALACLKTIYLSPWVKYIYTCV